MTMFYDFVDLITVSKACILNTEYLCISNFPETVLINAVV